MVSSFGHSTRKKGDDVAQRMKRNVRFIAIGLGKNVSESSMNEMSEGSSSNRLTSPSAEVSEKSSKSS